MCRNLAYDNFHDSCCQYWMMAVFVSSLCRFCAIEKSRFQSYQNVYWIISEKPINLLTLVFILSVAFWRRCRWNTLYWGRFDSQSFWPGPVWTDHRPKSHTGKGWRKDKGTPLMKILKSQLTASLDCKFVRCSNLAKIKILLSSIDSASSVTDMD